MYISQPEQIKDFNAQSRKKPIVNNDSVTIITVVSSSEIHHQFQGLISMWRKQGWTKPSPRNALNLIRLGPTAEQFSSTNRII